MGAGKTRIYCCLLLLLIAIFSYVRFVSDRIGPTNPLVKSSADTAGPKGNGKKAEPDSALVVAEGGSPRNDGGGLAEPTSIGFGNFALEPKTARRQRQQIESKRKSAPSSGRIVGYSSSQCDAHLLSDTGQRGSHDEASTLLVEGGEEDECLANDLFAVLEGEALGVRQRVVELLDRDGWEVEVWFMAGRRAYLEATHHYLPDMLRRFGGVATRVLWKYNQQQRYVPELLKKYYGPQHKASGPTMGEKPSTGSKRKEWRERRLYIPEFMADVRGNIRQMYKRAVHRRGDLSIPNDNWNRTIFVKIDDDVVLMAPHSVTYVVATLLGILPLPPHTGSKQRRKRCIIASGNVINHVGLNPVHYFLGGLRLPESRAGRRVAGAEEYKGIAYIPDKTAVSGSFQHVVEWRQAHFRFLRALVNSHHRRRGSDGGGLELFLFNRHAPGGGVFDFECDDVSRRWGINFFASPPLGEGHYSALRDLGHTIKNKDEVYFSTRMAKNTRESFDSDSTFTTCAVGKALVVHFFMTGQASNVRKVLGIKETDPKFQDASFLQPKLVRVYQELARHINAVEKCCRKSGCSVFNFTIHDFF